MKLTLAALSALLALSGSLATPIENAPEADETRVMRCGLAAETDEEVAQVNGIAQKLKDKVCTKFPKLPLCLDREEQIAEFGENITTIKSYIPVAFHVIYDPATGKGNVPDSQIQSQMNALNQHYGKTNIGFTLKSIDRTANAAWFNDLRANEAAIKKALGTNGRTTFHLYTGSFTQGLLGFCQFPWSYPEDSYMHGCMNLYSTLPGGSAAPYNQGKTITHEVGHGLGLYHTFQGGCRSPGDSVSDTPDEAQANYGCPSVNPDTCTTPGVDPIHNFMDYSDDPCLYEFTAGQSARLDSMIRTYRPGLIGATERTDMSSADPALWEEARKYQEFRAAHPKPVMTHADEDAGRHICADDH